MGGEPGFQAGGKRQDAVGGTSGQAAVGRKALFSRPTEPLLSHGTDQLRRLPSVSAEPLPAEQHPPGQFLTVELVHQLRPPRGTDQPQRTPHRTRQTGGGLSERAGRFSRTEKSRLSQSQPHRSREIDRPQYDPTGLVLLQREAGGDTADLRRPPRGGGPRQAGRPRHGAGRLRRDPQAL